MPPRKTKMNKESIEIAEQKIKSFVNIANENESSDSDSDTNIYIKSIKSNITPETSLETSQLHEAKKSKKQYNPRLKKSNPKVLEQLPTVGTASGVDAFDERYMKLFNDYKNELTDLKNTITNLNISNTKPLPPIVSPPNYNHAPRSGIDDRRSMMQLKFS